MHISYNTFWESFNPSLTNKTDFRGPLGDADRFSPSPSPLATHTHTYTHTHIAYGPAIAN